MAPVAAMTALLMTLLMAMPAASYYNVTIGQWAKIIFCGK